MDTSGTSVAELIPNEMLEQIFFYCSFEDLVQSVQNVCTRWRMVAQADNLWKDSEYCPKKEMSDQQIIDVFKHSPKLQAIVLKDERGGEVLRALSTHCIDLNKLEINACQSVTMDFINNLAETCPNIESLKIPDTVVADPDMCEVLGKFKKLKTLHCALNYKMDNYICLKSIGDHCDKLEHLELWNHRFSSGHLCDFLSKKKNTLRSLGIRCCNHMGDCILPLLSYARLTALTSLSLYGYYGCCEDSKAQHLGTLKTISSLKLEGLCSVSSENIIRLFDRRNMEQLTELSIFMSYNYNDAVTDAIVRNCPLLQSLSLNDCEKMTDESLKSIQHLKNLTSLGLFENVNLTDIGVFYLQDVESLKYLSIRSCCGIKRLGLELSPKFTALEVLNLYFQTLENLPWRLIAFEMNFLKELYIYKCFKIDGFALESLRRQMPHLKIILAGISEMQN